MSVRARAILSVVVALTFQGCAARTVPPLTEEQRAGLGRIGVVVLEARPEPLAAGPTPLGGVGAGALGVVKGLGVGVVSGAGCLATVGYGWPLCLSAIMTPYWIGRGAVEGAIDAVPERERRAGQAVIAAAIADVDPQRIARAVEQEAGRRALAVTVLPAAGARDGIDTVAEITLLRLGLETRPSGSLDITPKLSVPDVNPVLGLRAEARLRLLRTATDPVVFERTYVVRSRRDLRFPEWAGDEAAEFLRARDEALDDLAHAVAAELAGAGPAPPVPGDATPDEPVDANEPR